MVRGTSTVTLNATKCWRLPFEHSRPFTPAYAGRSLPTGSKPKQGRKDLGLPIKPTRSLPELSFWSTTYGSKSPYKLRSHLRFLPRRLFSHLHFAFPNQTPQANPQQNNQTRVFPPPRGQLHPANPPTNRYSKNPPPPNQTTLQWPMLTHEKITVTWAPKVFLSVSVNFFF